MKPISGLHHITAIAGPAQENLDFYAGVLGMRLVKKSVNQDDPGTYHLFYADAEGHPGTDLTFFPWSQLAPSRDGYGLSTEVSLAVPPDSLKFWNARLNRHDVQVFDLETRFGQRVLPLVDPHGLRISLTESADSLGRPFTPWERSPIPVENQIRGLESARMVERDAGQPSPSSSTASVFKNSVRRMTGSATACVKGSRVSILICVPCPRRLAAPGGRARFIISPGECTTRRTNWKCESKSCAAAHSRRR